MTGERPSSRYQLVVGTPPPTSVKDTEFANVLGLDGSLIELLGLPT